MFESPAGHAVRQSFEQIAATQGTLTTEETRLLKSCICDAVDELRQRGWPIERIIVRMKEVAAEVGLSRRPEGLDRDGVVNDAVRWSIERYFEQATDEAVLDS